MARSRRGTLLLGWLLAGCTAPPPPPEQAAAQAAEPPPALAADPVVDPPTPPPPPAPCKVEQLYAGNRPHALAVDATHVYFVQGSTLFRLPRAGGEPHELVDPVESEPPLLVDDALIVCRRDERYDFDLLRVAKDGSIIQHIGTADECKLALVKGQLYFGILVDGHKPWLARMPETGGAVERLFAIDRDLDRDLDHIVADASHVYYATGRGNLYRFDPDSRTSTQLVTKRTDLLELGITDTQLVWLEHGNLMRVPKLGPPAQPQIAANFQDVLGFAGSGDDLLWASVSDRGWRRLSAGDSSLRSFTVPTGSSLVVEGKRVFWNALGDHGGIFTLDTTTCGADVLVPSPAIRGIVGPESEDTLRYGYAEAGEVKVEVRDLSSDEHQAMQQVAFAHGYGRLPANADNLPPRFALGDPYRVATSAGVFDASLIGFELGYGGEGLHFYLILRIGDPTNGDALASKPDVAQLGVLREGPPSSDPAATYLEAVRAAFDEVGLDGKRVDADAMQIVHGKFPAPHVALIAVELRPPEGEDDEFNNNYLSALLLVDADGKISERVYGPDERLDRFAIEYLVDVDGDGIDEVLYSSTYYEGHYEHLLQWHDGVSTSITLAGDGA